MSQSELYEILQEVQAITHKLSDFEPKRIEELSLYGSVLEATSTLAVRIGVLCDALNY